MGVTVRQALSYVSSHPEFDPDESLEVKAWEHIARTLFDIANTPNQKIRGSVSQATRAQKLILNRMVGTRRAGTHPAVREKTGVSFVDLTSVELEGVPSE